jgi:hypothetical protein
MNINKTKLVLALTGSLFLAMPVSQVFAHEAHCEIKETKLGDTMKYMKSELRAYVKGFKSDDQDKMQKHLNELLKLSKQASQYTPVLITMNQHSDMDMEGMDHSKMDMKDMDHSKMDMKEMDHSKMDMKGMDHSKMDHGDMNMDSADHDMSTMPSMEGMTTEQHHQHMKYMQGIEQLQALFNELNQTKDKSEIKAILGKIKEHSKKSHQQFRQDC